MRVLVVHNRYSSRVPSGENLAVDDEVRWLRDAGVDVVVHEVSNDDMLDPGPLAKLRGGAAAVWSSPAARDVRRLLDAHRPDIVHVHNLFPLLTGSVPTAARRRGIPVVWTVHNRRARCVAGGNFRDGAPCHECRPGWRVPGLVHACYGGSAAASAAVTAASTAFRISARRGGVTAIAISRAMARWVETEAGIPPDRVRVKYNGVARPATEVPPAETGHSVVFLGRLATYKGLRLLLDAWTRADVDDELLVVGDGDLADEVRVAASRARIRLLPQVGPDQVSEVLAAARVVVVPSTWDEPFGRVAAEALAHGRPVVTTGTGGLSEIVDESCGWVTGIDPDRMAAAINEAVTSDDAVATRGRQARDRHTERFSPEATTADLLSLYADVQATA